MIMLYDSESFSVLHVLPNEENPGESPSLPRLGLKSTNATAKRCT